MKNFFKKTRYLLVSREDGVAAVEMVILFPVLVLLVVGLVEFGHLWYVRQTLTNASREGARAAVVHDVTDKYTDREAGAITEAQAAVIKYLKDTKFPGADTFNETKITTVNVVPSGAPTGGAVTVTVTDPTPDGGLILLNKLLPAFGGISLAAETTMRLE
jgi:Flp pilus assembly protein TadG